MSVLLGRVSVRGFYREQGFGWLKSSCLWEDRATLLGMPANQAKEAVMDTPLKVILRARKSRPSIPTGLIGPMKIV